MEKQNKTRSGVTDIFTSHKTFRLDKHGNPSFVLTLLDHPYKDVYEDGYVGTIYGHGDASSIKCAKEQHKQISDLITSISNIKNHYSDYVYKAKMLKKFPKCVEDYSNIISAIIEYGDSSSIFGEKSEKLYHPNWIRESLFYEDYRIKKQEYINPGTKVPKLHQFTSLSSGEYIFSGNHNVFISAEDIVSANIDAGLLVSITIPIVGKITLANPELVGCESCIMGIELIKKYENGEFNLYIRPYTAEWPEYMKTYTTPYDIGYDSYFTDMELVTRG